MPVNRKIKKNKKTYENFANLSTPSKIIPNLKNEESLFKKALNFLEKDKKSEAENIFLNIINNGSKNALPYINLSTLYINTDRKEKVLPLMKVGLKNVPNHPSLYLFLGEYQLNNNDFSSAIASLHTAINLDPQSQNGHILLGNAFFAQGEFDAAFKSYEKAVQLDANSSSAHMHIGNIFREKNEFKFSIEAYKRSLEIDQNNAESHFNFGLLYLKMKEYDKAISCFYCSLQIGPEIPILHINLGSAFMLKKFPEVAYKCFKSAHALQPKNPEIYSHLGNASLDKGNEEEALKWYQNALEINPEDPSHHANVGAAYHKLKDLKNSVKSYRKALDLDPDFVPALVNLSGVISEKGNLIEGANLLVKALKVVPDDVNLQSNLGHTLLLMGEYKLGLEKYEYRLFTDDKGIKPHARPKSDMWKNVPFKKGDKLIVVSEQGLGDTIQFMRYVKHLQSIGVKITFCVQENLHSIIKSSSIHSSPIIPKEGDQLSDSKWIPLLSIPKILEVTPKNPIINTPYIKPPSNLNKKWKKILAQEEKKVIGIHWQGNPRQEKNMINKRSIPLELFGNILNKNDIKFLSLQKGEGSEQINTCKFKEHFVKCQDRINEIWDFAENAAILSNCDLVITSDSALAHLSGGVGKQTWLLLKDVPDWRWGMDTEETFWYPSMKLFRQTEIGNWQEVLDRVASELKKYLIGKG